MRSRVDKLGVAEPIITQAGQGPDLDPARRRPQRRRGGERSSARPPSSSSTTSSRRSSGRRPPRSGRRSRTAASTSCSRACRRPRRRARRASTCSSSRSRSRRRRARARTRRRRRRRSTSRPRTRTRRRRSTATRHGNPGLLDRFKGGKLPKGYKVLTVPAKTVLITCYSPKSVVCPGDPAGRAAGRQDRLLPLQEGRLPERPLRDRRQVPEHEGHRAEALGHAPGLRPARPATRSC